MKALIRSPGRALWDGFDSAWRRAAKRSALYLLVALLNPFEINQWSAARSLSIWQRLTADHYAGVNLVAGAERGRDRITIVYLDDASLRQTGEARPLSAYSLIDLIEDVRLGPGDRQLPRAIFVDLLLTDAARKDMNAAQIIALADKPMAGCARRDPAVSPFACLVNHVATLTRFEQWRTDRACQASTLAKLECIRSKGGFPILFADPRSPEGPAQPSAALDALGFVAATTPVLVEQQRYPLVFPEDAAQRRGSRFQLYPAAALYRVLRPPPREPEQCPDVAGAAPKGLSCDYRGRIEWSAAFDRPVTVTWGIGRDDHTARLIDTYGGGTFGRHCRPAEPGTMASLWRIFDLGTAGIHRDAPPRCRYTDAIPAGLFQTGISPQELTALLQDRVVLIGAQFADSNDMIEAAPFGEVPGVFYHAMALDNLIDRGAAYPKSAGKIVPQLDISTGDLKALWYIFPIAFALGFGTRLIRSVTEREDEGELSYLEALPLRLGVLLPFGCVAFAVRYVEGDFTSLVPHDVNVVGPALMGLLGFAELLWASIEPERAAIVRRVMPGRTSAT